MNPPTHPHPLTHPPTPTHPPTHSVIVDEREGIVAHTTEERSEAELGADWCATAVAEAVACKIRAKAAELSHTSSASGLGGTYGSSGKYHPSAKGEARPPTSTAQAGQGQGLEPAQAQAQGQGQGQATLEDNDSGIFDLTTPLSDTGEIAVGDRLGGLSCTDQIYPLAPQFQVNCRLRTSYNPPPLF